MYRKRWDSLRGNKPMNSMKKILNDIEAIRDMLQFPNGYEFNPVKMLNEILEKYKSLLAEDSQKPQAPMGLVAELKEYCEKRSGNFAYDAEHGNYENGKDSVKDSILEILSKYHPAPETESLAELADRKGYWLVKYQSWTRINGPDVKSITLYNNGLERNIIPVTEKVFQDEYKTYSEAESKAREYLNGLNDRK